MIPRKTAIRLVAAGAALGLAATPAAAGCQRLAYSVNDYGKEGPTRDAKNLLDKYIATWTKEKGIKNFTVGKKDVKCELFLNLILFDEHTCEATALVCWQDAPGGAPVKATKPAPATPAAAPAPAPAAPAAKPPAAKKVQMPG
jgi:hypothetical protein